ncbi:thioredoxin family protein [Corynebacterium sp. 13CS0277]|uniref:glutaredoxin family protein n=1 Tax=Corynebacterium sp. 13CS0277 TaxID=2071994 RepID=UPI000D0439BD|nr:glutaredoxin family protein [Corynebacterium sp. 13CS0277]PRQ10680.1 thioredoxin family protein [Corynebacterium sp. 13CS0277]
MSTHEVELIVREGCGSCVRVHEQIAPIVAAHGARLVVVDIADDEDYRFDFGDRVPVVLVDGEEIAAWEVDEERLVSALL